MSKPADDVTHRKRKHRSSREADPERAHKSKKKRKRDHAHGSPQPRSKKDSSNNADQASPEKPTSASSLQDSPFQTQISSLYLPLSPISQLHPLEGLCAEHLSPLILTYYPPFRGVILSFKSARLSENPSADASMTTKPALAKSLDEYGATFIWVTAEFLLFKPRKDQWIEGWVNLQNEDHLGLVCWNLFNASIERKRLPKDWTWVDLGEDGKNGEQGGEESRQAQTDGVAKAGGYYQDKGRDMIEGLIRFRVKDIETSFGRDRGFLGIEGTMLDEEDEERLLEQEIS